MSAGSEDARPMMADAASASFSRNAMVPPMLRMWIVMISKGRIAEKVLVKGAVGSVRVN
jgi:hypothetical protein